MKKSKYLVLTAIAALALTGCPKNNDNPQPEPEPTPVEVVTLASIALEGEYKTVFEVGDDFTHAGLVVKATYSDGSVKTVESFTVSNPDMSSAGEKTVTVTFTDGDVTKTAEYTITVNEVVLTGITLSGEYKTVFNEDESFTSEGLVVTAHYSNETEAAVTGFTVAAPDMAIIGEQAVVVTYVEGGVTKTAQYTITVNEVYSTDWSAEAKAAMGEVLGFELPFLAMRKVSSTTKDGETAISGLLGAEAFEAYLTAFNEFGADQVGYTKSVETLVSAEYKTAVRVYPEDEEAKYYTIHTSYFGVEGVVDEADEDLYHAEVYFGAYDEIVYTDWSAEQKAAMLEAYQIVVPFIPGIDPTEVDVIDEDNEFYIELETENAEELMYAYLEQFDFDTVWGLNYDGTAYYATFDTTFKAPLVEGGTEYALTFEVQIYPYSETELDIWGHLTMTQLQAETWADVDAFLNELYGETIPEVADAVVYYNAFENYHYGLVADIQALTTADFADYLAALEAAHFAVTAYDQEGNPIDPEDTETAVNFYGAVSWEQGIELQMIPYAGEGIQIYVFAGAPEYDFALSSLEELGDVANYFFGEDFPVEVLNDLVLPESVNEDFAIIANLLDADESAAEAYYESLDEYDQEDLDYALMYVEYVGSFEALVEILGENWNYMFYGTPSEVYTLYMNYIYSVFYRGVGIEFVTTDDNFAENYAAALVEGGYQLVEAAEDNPAYYFHEGEAGDIKVVFSVEGDVVTGEIHFEIPAHLVGIELSGSYKTQFVLGEEFESEGLVVIGVYSDGTGVLIEEGFEVAAPDMSEAGEKEVVVTYGDFEASYTITVSEDVPPVPPVEPVTVNLTIADYAAAHNWVDGTLYNTVELDGVATATASEGAANNGKCWSEGTQWRFFKSESGTLTISVGEGYVIDSVTITFSTKDNGALVDANGDAVTSDTAYEVNADSVTFSVADTKDANKGKVFITAISVTYHAAEE